MLPAPVRKLAGLGMDPDGDHSQVASRASDADSDFAAVGDEEATEHSPQPTVSNPGFPRVVLQWVKIERGRTGGWDL